MGVGEVQLKQRLIKLPAVYNAGSSLKHNACEDLSSESFAEMLEVFWVTSRGLLHFGQNTTNKKEPDCSSSLYILGG